jgi:ankyrin repeat protein
VAPRIAAALRDGNVKALRRVLTSGRQPHWSWVCETMRSGHLNVSEMLVKSGVDRNVFTMAAMGDATGLKRRLSRVRGDARLTVNMEPASERVTPLHVACASDWTTHGPVRMATQVRIAQILCEYGADVNARSQYRGIADTTPLFCACWTSRNLPLVRWLLEHGARVNGGELLAALGHFQRHGKEAYDIAEHLLASGEPVDAKLPDARTPLHAFAFQGSHRTVAWLLAQGADVNARGPGRRTALHFAAQRNTGPKTLELLVDNGADLSAQDADGQTPLDIARLNGKSRLVEWIKTRLRAANR